MGILKFVMHTLPHFGQSFLPEFPDSLDFAKCPWILTRYDLAIKLLFEHHNGKFSSSRQNEWHCFRCNRVHRFEPQAFHRYVPHTIHMLSLFRMALNHTCIPRISRNSFRLSVYQNCSDLEY